MSKKKRLSPNEQVQEVKQWQKRYYRHLDPIWVAGQIESKCNAILKKHGISREELRNIDEVSCVPAVNAGIILAWLDKMRRHMEIDMMEAVACALWCGIYVGEQESEYRLTKKLSRTKTEIVDRIREMRKADMSDGQIAMQFNSEGLTTRKGTPFKRGNISSYRTTHNIQ